MHLGRAPSVRELAAALGYQSPRSAAILVERLIALRYAARGTDGKLRILQSPKDDVAHARTVDVPLVGTAPCGAPLLAEENQEAMIPVSTRLARPPHRYFLLRAQGDSMTDRGIADGSLVLVALIDDEATIKELRRSPTAIALTPRSKNPAHKPIILTEDFVVQGVVVAALPDITP
jgi:repressor LexA